MFRVFPVKYVKRYFEADEFIVASGKAELRRAFTTSLALLVAAVMLIVGCKSRVERACEHRQSIDWGSEDEEALTKNDLRRFPELEEEVRANDIRSCIDDFNEEFVTDCPFREKKITCFLEGNTPDEQRRCDAICPRPSPEPEPSKLPTHLEEDTKKRGISR